MIMSLFSEPRGTWNGFFPLLFFLPLLLPSSPFSPDRAWSVWCDLVAAAAAAVAAAEGHHHQHQHHHHHHNVLPEFPFFPSQCQPDLVECFQKDGGGGERGIEKATWRGGRKWCLISASIQCVEPNQQHILNKLPTDLRCRNFVNNHRLSMQIGAKYAKTCMQRVQIPTELPFCIPSLVVGK